MLRVKRLLGLMTVYSSNQEVHTVKEEEVVKEICVKDHSIFFPIK